MFGYQRACVDILGIQTIQICATARTHMGCWCSQTNLACPKPKDLSRYIYSCFHMIYNFLWFYYDFMTVFLPSDFNKDLHHLLYNLYILVSGFNHILKNMSSSMGFGLIIPYMMERQQKSCSSSHPPDYLFQSMFLVFQHMAFPRCGSRLPGQRSLLCFGSRRCSLLLLSRCISSRGQVLLLLQGAYIIHH